MRQADADACAGRIAETYPQARMGCMRCSNWFSLIGPDGRVSMNCSLCGLADSVMVIHQGPHAAVGRPIAQEPEPEPDPTEGRCDPPGLDDVIGNAAAVRWIQTVLDAFRADLAILDRRTKEAKSFPFPHTLLSGSGGTGKTMLAEIIAREINRTMRLQMGQSLSGPGRVGDVLLSLNAGEVLFIDEMHGLKPPCQESLYRAMEDRVYVPISRAGAPVVAPIRLPPFTLIGSTTDEWALLPSLLQRFKVRVQLERLSADELAAALLDRAKRKGLALSEEAARMIGGRSHGTPRLAIALLDGCVATAKAHGEIGIDFAVVEMACELLQIDELGLDAMSRKYLRFLADGGGKPVRVNVLATRLDGLSRLTVERRIEPDLVWLGLVEKGADGRRLTKAGEEYLKQQRK